MASTDSVQSQQSRFTNQILHGDCIETMQQIPANSVDFILTDPPYLVNYRDRSGRQIPNDANGDWLKPAMREAYRLLKPNRVAVMFYGWTRVDEFFAAWRCAGFQPVGHLVFQKTYSSKSRFCAINTSKHTSWQRADHRCQNSLWPMSWTCPIAATSSIRPRSR
jgi:DNA modification methylase